MQLIDDRRGRVTAQTPSHLVTVANHI